MSASGRRLTHAVCLGCGCACDDIEIHLDGARIVEARHACERGVAWFGDGRVPAGVLVDGAAMDLEAGLTAAAERLSRASRPLVYLASDVTCEAQRAAVALADYLRGSLDSLTSSAGLPSLLAAQERGRAGATLGEIRHRADLLLFWGVDPAIRYPRFMSRYAPAPETMLDQDGPSSRQVIAVDVGEACGPEGANRRFAVPATSEVDVLTALTAVVQRTVASAREATEDGSVPMVEGLLPLLAQARYVVVVVDGESRTATPFPASSPAEGIITLTQALNGITRAAAIVLREGGNRSGADAVLTWQTGFPAAVEFARGYPRYAPRHGTASARLRAREPDAVAIVGAMSAVPEGLAALMGGDSTIVIGPRATESRLAGRGVAIDTGVAGIHEGGTALRMDDVPLPLRAALAGPPATESIVRALTRRIVTNRGL